MAVASHSPEVNDLPVRQLDPHVHDGFGTETDVSLRGNVRGMAPEAAISRVPSTPPGSARLTGSEFGYRHRCRRARPQQPAGQTWSRRTARPGQRTRQIGSGGDAGDRDPCILAGAPVTQELNERQRYWRKNRQLVCCFNGRGEPAGTGSCSTEPIAP